ncbi:hypothetical protein [Chamaesiphon minutus]|uniref:hypothetical protein n=1 Tax=Chamaesiphon minutus TaxID=1173032 RepID=UPI000309D13C|nr:hypothetical protein [Chamaesiphon minutus]
MLIYSKFRQTQLDAPTIVCSIGSYLPIPTNDGYTYVKPSQLSKHLRRMSRTGGGVHLERLW